jgi:hypothetical protein
MENFNDRKKSLINITVCLLLRYAAETWAWTKAHIGRIIIARMKLFKHIK